jgi:ankyrin repeat protein
VANCVDVNLERKNNKGYTALQLAVMNSRDEAVQVLLYMGAEMLESRYNGQTLLMLPFSHNLLHDSCISTCLHTLIHHVLDGSNHGSGEGSVEDEDQAYDGDEYVEQDADDSVSVVKGEGIVDEDGEPDAKRRRF